MRDSSCWRPWQHGPGAVSRATRVAVGVAVGGAGGVAVEDVLCTRHRRQPQHTDCGNRVVAYCCAGSCTSTAPHYARVRIATVRIWCGRSLARCVSLRTRLRGGSLLQRLRCTRCKASLSAIHLVHLWREGRSRDSQGLGARHAAHSYERDPDERLRATHHGVPHSTAPHAACSFCAKFASGKRSHRTRALRVVRAPGQ